MNSKYSEATIEEIKSLKASGMCVKEIAFKFNISVRYIYNLVHDERYQHPVAKQRLKTELEMLWSKYFTLTDWKMMEQCLGYIHWLEGRRPDGGKG